ncbi:hypothetical protein OPV22_033046 [Ensete ventricosum]|uniref:SRP54-type proteins GTP-binding domain-containing protein n=1 Tax=Ensete ventricosum TaxID=4639 RepID=A0AAV8P1V3_ENSVE|nr:hypothetical protein OPV22_033046 [Ensete ventricosum]
MNPDPIIFVMESTVIIIFKYNLQATERPVIFIGTGENVEEFEIINVKPFVSRLLVVPTDQQPELFQKLSEGSFTCGLCTSCSKTFLKMGPTGQFFSLLPWFGAELMPKGHEKESQAKIKLYMTIMDSMTNAGQSEMSQKCWRDGYKHFAKMCSEMKGQFKISKKGKMSALSRNMNARHMSKVLPPQMLKQIGGMGGLQNFMKQMGFKDMGGLVGSSDEGTNKTILHII